MPENSELINTVDVVLLTLDAGTLKVALSRRAHAPYEGAFALIGGYVKADCDIDAADAAERVLREKTGLTGPYLEQLGTFSGAGRDPRGWSISVAYYALVSPELARSAVKGDVRLFSVDNLPALPFDHADIIRAAVDRVRSKSHYSTLPVFLCGDTFTLPQLQAVYEALIGEPVNKVSFRRKMEELDAIEPVVGRMDGGKANRPAQVYQLKPEFAHKLSLTSRNLNA